jgi:GAF domain-containing protein
LSQQAELVYRYDPKGSLAGLEKWRPETRTAAERGEPILSRHRDSATLTVPIILHDQVIGVIDAHKPVGAGEWTPEEIALMETFSEQMNLALDSARLHRESQRRVAREQAVGQVAQQLRGSLDIDTVLQTAVREIGEVMGLSEVQVQIAGDRLGAR